MIDAAANILSTMKASGNNANKTPSNNFDRNDNDPSFSSFYKNSKTAIEKDRYNKPDKDKQNEPVNRESQTSTNDNNVVREKRANDKLESNSTRSSSTDEDDKKTESSSDSSLVSTRKLNSDGDTETSSDEKGNSFEETIDSIDIETDSSVLDLLSITVLEKLVDIDDTRSDAITEIDDPDTSEDIDIQPIQSENGTLDEATSAIISEVKTSIENAQETNNEEESKKLSRAEVLANIKLTLDQDLFTEFNIPAQLLKPDLSQSINANRVISEQLGFKNLNVNTEVKLDLDLEFSDDSQANLDDTKDEILKKFIDKLDFNKLKNESISENKLSKIFADKTSISEFVEQLSPKLNSEPSASPLLSQVSGISNRVGIPSTIQQFTMNTQINQADWGSEFSKRINFMVGNDIKQAELRLDPPELGRINIKIVVNQDQASVVFTSAHGNVREAIENSLPRLRELLQDSGIQLSDANINERQQEKPNESDSGSGLSEPVFRDGEEELSLDDNGKGKTTHSVDGLIDYFA